MLDSDLLGRTKRRAPAIVLTERPTPPVVRWAWVGAAILVFISGVLGRWILTGKAVPTDPGPDPLPHTAHLFIVWVQWIAMLSGLVAFSSIAALAAPPPFALHAADGTPIMLTDSREAAIANAWSNELQAVSVH